MRRLSLALLIVVTAAAHADEAPDQQALRVVNEYRAAAGLAVVKLDPALSKGCMEHAEYMRLNREGEAMVGLNAHTQRPNLPGASKAGAACAKAADLFPGVANLGTAVHGWMAGIYHRRPILDPTLVRLGVGYATLPNGALAAALMFDDARDAKGTWPIAYPARDQRDVPLEYGNEIPNPIPGNGHGGYPITLQFPPFDKITKVRATLAVHGGAAIPLYLSDPEHPATSFPQSGIVSLIPKQPLQGGTSYDVRIEATWQGKRQTYTWSFTTIALRAIDASDIAALTAALGVPSRVHGTVTHGGMIDSGTVFLALADAHGKLVSVVMPVAIWKQLGRGKPEAMKGRPIEVEATPQLVGTKFINLTIGSTRQLKLPR